MPAGGAPRLRRSAVGANGEAGRAAGAAPAHRRLRLRRFDLAEGARATVRLRMSKRAFQILKQNRRLLLRVSATARDPAGNVGRAARRVTLLAPKPR